MSSVSYRILADSAKVRGLPAVRVVQPDGDGVGELFTADLSGKNAVDFVVPVGDTVAVYHGYISTADGEFVQVADPTSLTATDNPVKAVDTPTGKLYWIGAVANRKPPAAAVGKVVDPIEALPPPVVPLPPPEAAGETQDLQPVTETAEVSGVATDLDIAPDVSPPDSGIDVVLPSGGTTLNTKRDSTTWMPVADFAQLSLTRKRQYLRDIGIDGPVDMRTHAYMVEGYEKFFAAGQP
jgi:hypothetical protein